MNEKIKRDARIIITKVSELPSGKILNNDAILGLDSRGKENIAIYIPNDIQSKEDGAPTKVWILIVHEFQKREAFLYHELRTRLQKNKEYSVDKIVNATSFVVQSLYENFSFSNEQNELQSGELKDFYEEMVHYAIKESISDIHIEKRATRSIIRMRKHGQLIDYKEPTNVFTDRLCRAVFNVLAENKDVNYRDDIFQAAAVNTVIRGEEVKLRYQSLPVYPDGFDVVLRVLPIGSDDEKILPLDKLGYLPTQVKQLLDIANKPVGALIIAGTTGSGKSTTLKNLLMHVNEARQYRTKIYTIEDPPEYKIPGVSQIPVVRRDKDDPTLSPFLEPLKATMRGDPDLLMIGEVRDVFTADGLKKATQSGHQVMTTVHATSALGIVERLGDMSISPSVMGSPEFINGLIYQKLLPIVCPKCSYKLSDSIQSSSPKESDIELSRRIEDVADLSRHEIKIRGNGCEHCNYMGIIGRTVCAEIIIPDYNMLEHFRHEDPIAAQYYWMTTSDRDQDSDDMTGKTVLEHALYKMRKGIVCPYDIETVMGPVNSTENIRKQMDKKFNKNNNKSETEKVGLNIFS